MSLDRESIERKNFPVDERGYDPAAVDAHLSALADEVEVLRRGAQHSPAETLAGAVSEQVRGIVEAAESSAEEIIRGAELEAQDIRARASQATEQATGEAQRVRERATAQAREYVERLSSSISTLLGRLDAIDGELHSLTVSLRSETERLRGELAALEDELEGVTGVTDASAPVFEATPTAPARAPARFSEPISAPVRVQEPAVSAEVTEPEAEVSEGPAELASESAKLGDEPVAEFPTAGAEASAQAGADLPASEQPTSQDIEGARLIALNMALNGNPREETERYLAENYDLANRQRLLDEVYASVQG